MILETDQEEFSQDAHLYTSRACDASNVVKFIFSEVILEVTVLSGNKNRVYVVYRGRAYSFLLTKILRNFVNMQRIGCKTMSARSGRLCNANKLSCYFCQMN